MSVAARPDSAGKTRICPHCKATILESLTICPGCLHHLRFDQAAAKRQVAAASALRVEGIIKPPPDSTPWEYFVVIAVRNERGEEVVRQVVNVGALQNSERRSFTLSVDVMPPQPAVVPNKPAAPQPSAARPSASVARPAAGPMARPAQATAPSVAPGGAVRPAPGSAPSAAPATAPKAPTGPMPPTGPTPPKR
ncbi:MAG TPA: hypothetical protein VKT54_06340 [Steroidobacteraceae bacterium]|nr:hypothetical protein [Steroidobacteraceae bacterium]